MIQILIVDDDLHFIEFITPLLTEHNYHVLTAKDGEEGLIIALKCRPNLILLDVEMPKMRGWEVCNLLKHNPYSNHIPILMLTSRSEPSDIISAMQFGADDYLAKPFDNSDLLNRIERLLAKSLSEEKNEKESK
jgi:DNA-binding response OmpR family regulator